MSFFELIKSRRTVRKFIDRAITKEQLTKYIDAARVAPSAMNMQPVRFVGVINDEKIKEIYPYTRWGGYLPEYKPEIEDRPAAFVAVCINKDSNSVYSEFDMGLACENLILSALEDGIGACILGAIDRPKITEILEIPESLKLCYLIGLGYSKDTQKEVAMKDGNNKYYIENGEICVPKRSMNEVLIDII